MISARSPGCVYIRNERQDGQLLTFQDVFPETKVRDITRAVNSQIFPPIPDGADVVKASACVIGDQGCGKTILMKSITAEAFRRYGRENVHPIYTDDIRVALDLLDDTPVQLVMVDDAMTHASSRQVSEQTAIIKVYNRSRHVFEGIRNGKPGVIIYIWAWQRFKELDPSFRQADVMIFKTGISEPTEATLIQRFIGGFYYGQLGRIWNTMKSADKAKANAIKAKSVARISSLDVNLGTGIYSSPMTSCPGFPEQITHDAHFADEIVEDDILSEVQDKPEWALRVEIYRYATEHPEETQMQIAAAIGELHGRRIRQGYVSESLRKVKALIESK